jgi:hypothetical protein
VSDRVVFTYCNCAVCSRIARGNKLVPRSDAQQSNGDAARGRTVKAWVTDVRYPVDHKRPVCSECEAKK